MLRVLILERFPNCEVQGECDDTNTGNFVVEAASKASEARRIVLSAFGFLTTTQQLRRLLRKILSLEP